jgi:hypothetical protein
MTKSRFDKDDVDIVKVAASQPMRTALVGSQNGEGF